MRRLEPGITAAKITFQKKQFVVSASFEEAVRGGNLMKGAFFAVRMHFMDILAASLRGRGIF